MASLEELRRRIGRHLSDEEFLLRATMPGGPGRCDGGGRPRPATLQSGVKSGPRSHPKTLARAATSTTSAIDKAGMKLELRRHVARAAARHRSKGCVVERTAQAAAPPRLKGLMFDLDGTLLLSDRSLGSYEILPGAAELLTELARRAVPFRRC